MKIKVQAYIPETSYIPGEFIDVRESDAQLWIKSGWARSAEDKPAEVPADEIEEIEIAAFEGAPEKALSKRGRRRKRR